MGKALIVAILILCPVVASAGETIEGQSTTREELAELERLRLQIEALRQRLEIRDTVEVEDSVDLSGEELASISETESSGTVFTRPWHQNLSVSGFGAFWLADSGSDGTRPEPGFVIKETTLFVEANAWDDISFFFEIQTNALQRDNSQSVSTGEVYAHFRNVLRRWGDDLLSVKVGRVDIPFGEEYLWQDAPDNPLISNSAAYPWLWDEGLVLYGKLRGIGWVASMMDGTIARSVEDDPAKAVSFKLYGTPWTPLYLSASVMKNGATAASALILGGSLFQPVGVWGESALGQSPSKMVDALLYEGYAKVKASRKLDFEFSYGRAFVNDEDRSFDRDLTWFMVQPRFFVRHDLWVVARYSEIGTYDSNAGYHFGGEFLAGGNQAFGYDAKRLQRFSVGAGWRANPRVAIKLEVGLDRYEVIDASPLRPGDDDRNFSALEVVVSF